MNILPNSRPPLYWCPLERRMTNRPHEACALEHRARKNHREEMKRVKTEARLKFYASLRDTHEGR